MSDEKKSTVKKPPVKKKVTVKKVSKAKEYALYLGGVIACDFVNNKKVKLTTESFSKDDLEKIAKSKAKYELKELK